MNKHKEFFKLMNEEWDNELIKKEIKVEEELELILKTYDMRNYDNWLEISDEIKEKFPEIAEELNIESYVEDAWLNARENDNLPI